MNNGFSLLPGEAISHFIDNNYLAVFDIIKSTYSLHEEQKTVNPNSYFLRFPDNPDARIIALPAAINDNNKISGIKWIASYPLNMKKYKIPRASAVIILNDYETGYPLACLEGSIISAVRTACSAILAAEYIRNHKKNIKTLGFIGNGFIAKHIYTCFISLGWHIETIYLFDSNTQSSQNLQEFISQKFTGNIEISHHYQDLLKKADVTVLATTAPKPYIDDFSCFSHLPTILHISLRDISPHILIESNNIVDDIDHVLSARTAPDLTYQKYNTKNFIQGTIGGFLKNKFKLDDNKPTIFSPMGMGILDIAIANFVYQNISADKKITIKNFHSG